MKRNTTIDMLRGIAMIAMILIHTSYYFIAHDSVALFVWNWSQFAVPLFIFCSGYVFFLKPSYATSIRDYIWYLFKRARRLVLPYYVFLIFFFPIVWFTTGRLTLSYITQSLFLIGGADINWLVLLMLELALVLPLLSFLQQKNKFVFCFSILLACVFSTLSFHLPFVISYKPIMWIGWSLIALSSWLFVTYSKRPAFLFISFFLSLGVFLLTYVYALHMHHDLSFYGNKYPPTLFMLSYGTAAIAVFYYLAEKHILVPVAGLLRFVSTHSYSLFFIHYSILILSAHYLTFFHELPWYLYFLFVFLLSLVLQKTFQNLSLDKGRKSLLRYIYGTNNRP